MSTRLVLASIAALSLVTLAIVGVLVNWHAKDAARLESVAREQAKRASGEAAAQINRDLAELRDIGISLAEDLREGRLADEDVEARLLQDAGSSQVVSSVTVAYDPRCVPSFANADRYALYAFVSSDSDPRIELIGYDYTLPDGTNGPEEAPLATSWYRQPLDRRAEVWSEPYLGDAGIQWAGFGVPFYKSQTDCGGQEPAGVVDVSLTLQQFQDVIANIQREQSGGKQSISRGDSYGFIVSQSGTFISHPTEAFVTQARNISNLPEFTTIEQLQDRVSAADTGSVVGPVLVPYTDGRSGRPFWVFLAPISSSNWWVGIALEQTQFLRDADLKRLRQQRISIAMGGGVLLTLLSVFAFGAYRGDARGLWFASTVFSLLAASVLGYIWYTNLNVGPDQDDRNIPLVDQASTNRVINDVDRTLDNQVFVPTGVFVQSVEFSSASNLTITGYVWQRYPVSGALHPATGAAIEPGFILPEAKEAKITQAYQQQIDGEKIIGWNFSAGLRQEFNFNRYPFDRANLWVRLWHQDFSQNVVLVPDLRSYSTTDPTDLPGVEQQDFVLEGWDLTHSNFSYRQNRYNTGLGIRDPAQENPAPELYFNLGLKREFVNVFISNLIPVMLVAILLFAVLLTTTGTEEGSRLLGFSASTVLSFGAALFFVVVVSHINLRTSLTARGLIYLELLYFVLYAAILAVVINSLLVASPTRVRLIHYRNNLLVRLLYWPVILAILLGMTIFIFG